MYSRRGDGGPAYESGQGRRRSSAREQAMYVAQTISHHTVDKSKRAVHHVGSFLGITEDDHIVDHWKDKFLHRVESGDIGFHVRTKMRRGSMDDKECLQMLDYAVEKAQYAQRRHEAELAEMDNCTKDQYLMLTSLLNEDDNLSQQSFERINYVTNDSTLKAGHVKSDSEVSLTPPWVNSPVTSPRATSPMAAPRSTAPVSSPPTKTRVSSSKTSRSGVSSKTSSSTASPSGKTSRTMSKNWQTVQTVVRDKSSKTSAWGTTSKTSSPRVGQPQTSPSHNTSRTMSKNWQTVQTAVRDKSSKTSSRGAKTSSPQVVQPTVSSWGRAPAPGPFLPIPDVVYDKQRRGRRQSTLRDFIPFAPKIPSRKLSQALSSTQPDFRKQSITFNKQVKTFKPSSASVGGKKGGSNKQPTRPVSEYMEKRRKSSLRSTQPPFSADTQFLDGAQALSHYDAFIEHEMDDKEMQLLRKKTKLERDIVRERQNLRHAIQRCKEHQAKKRTCMDVLASFNPLRCMVHRDDARFHDMSMQSRIRLHREENEEHRPWFITIITLIQIVSFGVLYGLGGLTTFGLEPELRFSVTTTFKGTETKEHWHINNIWLGPSYLNLIRLGALYGPCLRHDKAIISGFPDVWKNVSFGLGCCEMVAFNTAGTTFEVECTELTSGRGQWEEGTCAARTGDDETAHLIKPCCHGVKGHCNMTSRDHCKLLEGVYIEGEGQPEHCSQ